MFVGTGFCFESNYVWCEEFFDLLADLERVKSLSEEVSHQVFAIVVNVFAVCLVVIGIIF